MVSENYRSIDERICAACERSGRKRSDVLLLPVSKMKPVSLISELYDSGVRDFGENYVQEFLSKYEELPPDISWHLIGHLQSNKVKYISGKTKLIHSVDSFKLAETIDKEAKKRDIITDILVEVNVAEEDSKFGITCGSAPSFIEEIAGLQNIRVKGLMTIAPFVSDPEENRPVFRALKQLSVDIASKNINNVSVSVLSMGMTNDFEVAVEEGSNIVRVGTAIFGER